MMVNNKEAHLYTLETEGMKIYSCIPEEVISHPPLPCPHPSHLRMCAHRRRLFQKKGTVTSPSTPLHTKTAGCLCDPNILAIADERKKHKKGTSRLAIWILKDSVNLESTIYHA